MRIVYLTPGCFDKGGISRYSRYQIAAWREIVGASNVVVLSILGPGADAFESPFAVDWHAGGVSDFGKLAYVAQTLRYTRRFRPSFIHAAHVNLAALAYAAARTGTASVALNVYGLEVWSGLRRDAEWGLRHSDLVISDCHFTAGYLMEHGVRCQPPTVIWDCVDLEQFKPGRPPKTVLERYGIPNPESGINLLTLGRMTMGTEHKGYERLYSVFRRIADHLPPLRLIYAGRGELADRLAARARRDGFSDRVFFTGMIREDDLPDVYRSGHIFSLVSDRGIGRGEGIPLTPLEAAGCGLPILVGDEDGSQEGVVHGENGYVLKPFDLDTHARRIVELANDAQQRMRMGMLARQHVERQFGFPTFVERHRELLSLWRPGGKRESAMPPLAFGQA